MNRKSYKLVGLGGSFDHFHAGHAHFLKFASNLGQKLLIGVTDDHLTNSKLYPNSIEDLWHRKHAVKEFCGRNHLNVSVLTLHDAYGPTLEGTEVEALAVTNETAPGAEKINQLRTKLGLRPLPVFICTMFKDETNQELHSENIRAGIVNRAGKNYHALLNKTIHLTDHQRQELAKPLAHLIDLINYTPPKPNQHRLICVVGDKSLETFIDRRWSYSLGVYDQKQQRQLSSSAIIDSIKPQISVVNKPGEISIELAAALQKTLNSHSQHLKVEGEEDLATAALALLLPLGSIIYYGQPNQGIIELEITEQSKELFRTLLTEHE
jgi:pantetheine-phosphate adenylyltransferase